ncbi:hypothetical protein B0H14DRAFT_2580402 [Mycena olivaceomarginata]|nr:hypothetical protein B0H14DRAFT_2580402 [Mycena olivaceomarginata]
MPETNDSTTVVRIRASQFCSEGKGFNFKGFETALAELFSQFASMKTKAESLPDVKNAIMVITNYIENCDGHERGLWKLTPVSRTPGRGTVDDKKYGDQDGGGTPKSDAAVLAIRFQLDRPSSSCACVPLPCSRRSEVGNKRQRDLMGGRSIVCARRRYHDPILRKSSRQDRSYGSRIHSRDRAGLISAHIDDKTENIPVSKEIQKKEL